MKTISKSSMKTFTSAILLALLLGLFPARSMAQAQCYPQFITQITFSAYYSGWRAADAIEVKNNRGGVTGYLAVGSTSGIGIGYPLLVKTDQLGNIVDDKAYLMSNSIGLIPEKVVQSFDPFGEPDGFVFVANETSQGPYQNGGAEVRVVKVDNSMNLVWERRLNSSNRESGQDIIIGSDGAIIVAGHTRGAGHGGYDIFIHKMTPFGGDLWRHTYGSADNEYGYGLIQNRDGDYVVTGSTDRMGANEVLLLKVSDWDGDQLFMKHYGTNYTESAGFAVVQRRNGGYGITGNYGEQNQVNDNFPFLLTTDAQGNFVSGHVYSSNVNGTNGIGAGLYEVATKGCQPYFIIGGSWNKHGFVMKTYGASIEFMKGIKNDNPTSAGYSSIWNNSLVSFERTRNDGLLLSGHGNDELWLVKTGVQGYVPECMKHTIAIPTVTDMFPLPVTWSITTNETAGIPVAATSSLEIVWDGILYRPCVDSGDREERLKAAIGTDATATTLYPNPNNGRFTVRFADEIPAGTPVMLVNSLGQIVWKAQAQPGQEIDAELTDAAKGVYFLRIGQGSGGKKIVIR